MQNKGIIIWLVLLTSYLIAHEYLHHINTERRKEAFESFETFLNGPLNNRVTHIENFLDERFGAREEP